MKTTYEFDLRNPYDIVVKGMLDDVLGLSGEDLTEFAKTVKEQVKEIQGQ